MNAKSMKRCSKVGGAKRFSEILVLPLRESPIYNRKSYIKVLQQ